MKKAQESGVFYFVDADFKFDQPQTTVVVDREKAAMLGLTMRDVGSSLGAMLGGGYINYFSMGGRSYQVIPQVQQSDRLNPDQLNNYFIRTANGSTVAASTIISYKTETVPEAIRV